MGVLLCGYDVLHCGYYCVPVQAKCDREKIRKFRQSILHRANVKELLIKGFSPEGVNARGGGKSLCTAIFKIYKFELHFLGTANRILTEKNKNEYYAAPDVR